MQESHHGDRAAGDVERQISAGESLVSAFVLDGNGGGREVEWEGIRDWRSGEGTLWVHLNREGDQTVEWLTVRSGLPDWACEALLAEETRPRVTEAGDALLLILRGVNLNPGADPEDMVSLRLWIERDRIISTRKRQVMAIADIRNALRAGSGPHDVGDFLAALTGYLVDRMAPVIGGIDDQVDEIEERVLTAEGYELRTELATLRRQSIALRRYIGPQREAMARLQTTRMSWLDDICRLRLREVADRVTRYVEDLDSTRERAAVTQEELSGRLAEQMNSTMYRLSVVATIFLPLGLLTGLLGINVAGIPGTNNPLAFTLVTGGLFAIAIFEVLLFRRRRLL